MGFRLRLAGAAATAAIALILLAVLMGEPTRQQGAVLAHRRRASTQAVELYVRHCVDCHGLAGEGINVAPALSAEHIRGKDAILLFRTIERGRSGTEMAAFGIDEGGNLTAPQIDTLVILIKEGEWSAVASRSAALNIGATWSPTPPPSPTPTSTTAAPTAIAVSASPSTESQSVVVLNPPAADDAVFVQFAVDTYGAKCSECHGVQGEGKPPDVADLGSTRIRRMSDENLLSIINFGVENTEMRPFRSQLTEEEKQALVFLIRHIDAIR